ncbi:MAG: hypothetical protein KC766_27465 [Myxococcales bacterium]|nr:hypothetical protein [Myxococcales bacterium]
MGGVGVASGGAETAALGVLDDAGLRAAVAGSGGLAAPLEGGSEPTAPEVVGVQATNSASSAIASSLGQLLAMAPLS